MKITPNQASLPIQKQQLSAKEKMKESGVEKAPEKDAYILSQPEKIVNYKKPVGKVNMETVEALKAESERTYAQLRDLVQKLLKEQGLTMKDVMSGDKQLVVDDETRLKAQEAIGEGGPFSPEKVSDRLLDFAKAVSGGDKSKLDLLRNAIDEGFKAAKEILGGTLPEISEKTYEMTMKKLDKWASEE